MKIKTEIQKRENEFFNLCHKHQVNTLYAFGSSVTDQFNEKSSDIDLLVEIDEEDPIKRGELLMGFWDNLEDFFKRRVDLLTNSSIKNPVLRNSIDMSKILVYDRRWEKVFS
jgi:uncharacterized protein